MNDKPVEKSASWLDRIDRSLVWFALGIVVSTVVGTAGFYVWLESHIEKITPRIVQSALSDSKIQELVDTNHSKAFEQMGEIRADAKEANRLVGAIRENLQEARRNLEKFPTPPKIGNQPQTEQTNVSQLPKGSILLFDADCPSNWDRLKLAGGRFLVGAGKHGNSDSVGNRLPEYGLNNVGGLQEVQILEKNLPRHDHKEKDRKKPTQRLAVMNKSHGIKSGFMNERQDDRRPNLTDTATIEPFGNEKPDGLDITPPYIALYFCKKRL